MAAINMSLLFGVIVVVFLLGYPLYIGIQKMRGEGFVNKTVNVEGFDEMHQADKLGLILGSIVVLGIVAYYIGKLVTKGN
jgi:hypothetical protein